tara:strand:+ start:5811 stop:7034 length:1224 start_codon:yes stop_codon:yes gene_type:complete
MAANNRIFYACQQVGLKPDGDRTNAFAALHGVQSVGITTNFNLSQVFELGQISIYENIEDIPDVEVSMTKVLDGTAPIYCMATRGASSPTLSGRQNQKSVFALGIWPDTNDSANGTPNSQVECSGMFVSSLAYNFPLEDNFTEDVTLVGNHKIWHRDTRVISGGATANAYGAPQTPDFTGAFTDAGEDPSGLSTGGGVNRRENLLFGTVNLAYSPAGSGLNDKNYHRDPDLCCLPNEIHGIKSSGTNELDANGNFGAHISNITVSADLGREQILELGRKAPYHRYATFPIEVTTEVEVTAISGDMISATEEGILSGAGGGFGGCSADSGNLTDATIRIATCEGTRIYLGKKNKLASVNYAGGDAGGGNATVTYTFTTFNDFTVMHQYDFQTEVDDWWDNRMAHLAPA